MKKLGEYQTSAKYKIKKQKENNSLKDVYGPGDDNYGRDKHFWKENSDKEKCVMCGAETPYTKDTLAADRNYYVEGAGQLCRECYEKIYAASIKLDNFLKI